MAREKRSFQMDQQLLVDIIKRQAGSLWKAISEAVMNAVDAGATKCDIELTRQMLIIRDNGKGFRTRNDIEQYFEIFGKPHEAQEDKTFGRFRMGRGQLFAFGANTWRSHTFEMTVDIEKDGLDYHLATGQEKVDGCTITVMLYQQLSNTDFARIVSEIKSNGKYLEIPTTINGESFAVDRSKQQWDLELPEADIKFRSNQDLRVYNQGVLVRSYYRTTYGAGGDVVTKVPLQVNFARNDIMDSCPVWRKLQQRIAKYANEQATNARRSRRRNQQAQRPSGSTTPTTRPRLTEEDRVRLVNQLKDGALSANQYKGAQLWTRELKNGNVSLRTIYKICEGKVTVPPENGSPWSYRRRAEQIEQNELACVVSRETIKRFGVEGLAELVHLSNAKINHYDQYKLKYIPWEDLCATLDSTSQAIPDDKLTPLELTVIEVLRKNRSALMPYAPISGPARERELVVGHSPGDSWTDGHSLIGISRDYIKRHGMTFDAWFGYANLIMYESLHDVRTDSAHTSVDTFWPALATWYRRPSLAPFVKKCMASMQRIADQVGHEISLRELAAMDELENAQDFAESRPDFAGTAATET